MRGQPITVFNRYTGEPFTEAVYGEGVLRFAYESGAGRFLTDALVSRVLLSRIYGWLMNRPSSARKIPEFIREYGIDPEEFAKSVNEFRTFNEFFRRELKPGARPVYPAPDSVVFPADGRHMGWECLGTEKRVFIKGQSWDLEALLGGDRDLINRFRGGSLVISRLCPVDYHHFHFPVDCRVAESQWMGRRLYSVNPVALRQRLGYLWQNRRCLTRLDAGAPGEVAFIEVGATNVGTIRHHPLPEDSQALKGAPKGWFEFGGSTVITLFQPGVVRLCEDLLEQTGRSIELYARCGDIMGNFSQ